MEYTVLQNTRLQLPYEMGTIISRCTLLAWHRSNLKVMDKSNNNSNYKNLE